MTPGGIDILILRGPTLAEIIAALVSACGLSPDDIIQPTGDIMSRIDVLKRPLRASIFALSGGDFDHKVDIDGLPPRDYVALARDFGTALGHGVAFLDEDKPDPFFAILLRPGLPDIYGYINDAKPDGATFHVSVSATPSD